LQPVHIYPEKTEKRVPTSTWILLSILLIVIIVAFVHPFAKKESHETQVAPYGDIEEATAALAEVLLRTPPAQRLSLLLRYAQDKSPGLRYAAVDALGNEQGTAAAKALEQAFADSASHVRQRALEVLPNVDSERGLRLLLAALRDEDTWIRQAAATQLSLRAGSDFKTMYQRAIPMLLGALHDPDPVVFTMAMSALRKLTGQPWRVKSTDPEFLKRRMRKQWEQWWTHTALKRSIPPFVYRDHPYPSYTRRPCPKFYTHGFGRSSYTFRKPTR